MSKKALVTSGEKSTKDETIVVNAYVLCHPPGTACSYDSYEESEVKVFYNILNIDIFLQKTH